MRSASLSSQRLTVAVPAILWVVGMVLGLVAGCDGRPADPLKLDLVFMIDNAGSLYGKQSALRRAWPDFLAALSARPEGLPDLRIGIVTSNVGAGPEALGEACPPGGDHGHFQIRPECGLAPAGGPFLAVAAGGTANFTGGVPELATALSCLSDLGVFGCGYEHQLRSVQLALDGKSNPDQAAFLRDDAVLGVVMLSDEDDCSAPPDATLFAGVAKGQGGSLRCALRGHVCAGMPLPEAPFSSLLADCDPYRLTPTDDPRSRLIDVEDFVATLQQVKRGRAERIFVGAIVGWSEEPDALYRLVQANSAGGLELQSSPICSDPAVGDAYPAIRLHAFATSFANHSVYSACTPDLSGPMAEMGSKLAAMVDR